MTATIDRAHMRQVRLHVMEVKTLSALAQMGGERNADTIDPSWRPWFISLMEKQLIEPCAPHEGATVFLRLTDQGRAVAGQLEAMTIKAPVVVDTTGERAPEDDLIK